MLRLVMEGEQTFTVFIVHDAENDYLAHYTKLLFVGFGVLEVALKKTESQEN